MSTFEYLQLKEVPGVKSWYLKISSLTDLLKYHEIVDERFAKETFLNYSRVCKGHAHIDMLTQAIIIRAERKNNIFIRELGNFFGDVVSNQMKLLSQNNNIFINSSKQGYAFDTKNYSRYNKLKEIQTNDYKFPESNEELPRYTQWIDGKHWYVRIGETDVFDKEGNQKWNSREQAEKAVKWFLNNKETITGIKKEKKDAD